MKRSSSETPSKLLTYLLLFGGLVLGAAVVCITGSVFQLGLGARLLDGPPPPPVSMCTSELRKQFTESATFTAETEAEAKSVAIGCTTLKLAADCFGGQPSETRCNDKIVQSAGFCNQKYNCNDAAAQASGATCQDSGNRSCTENGGAITSLAVVKKSIFKFTATATQSDTCIINYICSAAPKATTVVTKMTTLQ